jgi:hypothetical protein
VVAVQQHEHHVRVRRRQAARLDRLKRRIGLASVLSFAALFGLAAQHAVGSTKHRAATVARTPPRSQQTKVHFFDETGEGYAFADPTAPQSDQSQSQQQQQQPQQQPTAPPPPVAQTSVS